MAVLTSTVPLSTPISEEYPVVIDIMAIVIIGPTVYIIGVLSNFSVPGGGSIVIIASSIPVLNLGSL